VAMAVVAPFGAGFLNMPRTARSKAFSAPARTYTCTATADFSRPAKQVVTTKRVRPTTPAPGGHNESDQLPVAIVIPGGAVSHVEVYILNGRQVSAAASIIRTFGKDTNQGLISLTKRRAGKPPEPHQNYKKSLTLSLLLNNC
jgi:hypothetical protein